MPNVLRRLRSFTASDTFFLCVIVLFVLQALWAAGSLLYPIAFDENYHLGIIKIYAEQWSPFIASQPENTGNLGQLTHLPSFLYHYLMSFPYRLLALVTESEIVTIIMLRMINIGLFAGGLLLFRKFLLALNIPKSIAHLSLGALVLIPSSMLLAAGVNYDNLLFLFTPLFLLATLRLAEGITKKREVSFTWTVVFLSVGALASTTKYPFLPIFAGASLVLFVLWCLQKHRLQLLGSIVSSYQSLSWKVLVPILTLGVISLGFFGYRYGTNIATFHSIDPACDTVLSVEACSSYGPWIRDYMTLRDIEKSGLTVQPDLLYFEQTWVTGMVHRLYFAINHEYRTAKPLPLSLWFATITGLAGLGASLIFWRRIHRAAPYLWIFLVITGIYVLSIQVVNFSAYSRLGQLVAVNGRYLIPLLPVIIATFMLGIARFIDYVSGKHSTAIKTLVIVVAAMTTLATSGFVTYLIYSDSSWFWPQSPLVGINEWLGAGLRSL